MSVIRELFHFMRQRKKWWLVPVIIMLAVVAGLVVYLGGSAVAPLIYTLF